MMFSLLIFLLVTYTAAAASTTTSTRQFCRTSLWTSSEASVPTATRSVSVTRTRNATSTYTPTSTFTPSSATVFIVGTSTQTTCTTLSEQTDTFYTTLSYSTTVTSVAVANCTTTSTNLVTVTGTYTTLTIQPSSGFIPLATALATQGLATSKHRKRIFKDRILADTELSSLNGRGLSAAAQISLSSDQILYSPLQWPGSVMCFLIVETLVTNTVTTTAATSNTVTAAQGTITQTSTSTITETSTITPVTASTTLTSSTTSTFTSTSTTTSILAIQVTTTTTIFSPQPTFYAVCAANNIVSYVNNQRISNIASSGFAFGSTSTDAYGCCVQCAQSSLCGGTAFHPASGTCYFFPLEQGTCNPNEAAGAFLTEAGSNVGYQLSNSNCGQIVLGGS